MAPALVLFILLHIEAAVIEDDIGPADHFGDAGVDLLLAMLMVADDGDHPVGAFQPQAAATAGMMGGERLHLEAGEHQASALAPTDADSPQELVGQQLSRGGSNSLFRKILPRFRTLLEHIG